MKKLSFLTSLGALALCTACSNQEAPVNPVTGSTESHFINVSIAMSDGASRATSDEDFKSGENKESAISKVYFVFYNESGNVVASQSVSSPELIAGTSSVENKFTAAVEFELPVGAALPKYVMAFANPSNTTDLKNSSISEIAIKQYSDYKDGGGDFSMTNAVYFNPTTKEQVMAVATSTEMYYTSEEEKNTATPVEIYIERQAAKVKTAQEASFNSEPVNIKDKDGNAQELTFVIDSWGLNCLEKSTYNIKYFKPTIYTETWLDNEFNTAGNDNAKSQLFEGWNDQNNHRSYWANSPTYGLDKDDYPDVSDDLYTGGSNFLTNTPANASSYNKTEKLNYRSFNQMTNQPGDPDYWFENTVTQAIPSAMTSVIVCGHYVDGSDNVVPSFYVIGQTYYTENDLKGYMLSLNQDYLHKSDGTTSVSATDIEDFEIVHPTVGLNTVGGEATKNAERLVTIRLKSDKTGNYTYKKGSDYVAVTSTNLSDVNQKIYENAQVAEAYTEGKAYFVWPIRHLNNVEGEKGYYGVVRNHWYDVNITSITGLGIGVFNPDIPIVPTDDTTKYGLKVDVKILKWRLVKQDATLKK